MKELVLIFLLAVSIGSAGHATGQEYKFPPLPAPEQYGNILISRTSAQNNVKSVTFSHWSHRMKYTCRVCHVELEFSMKVNATEVTEQANREGRFCGGCHNGTAAFGHTEGNCDKCHNGDISYGKEKFRELASFPSAPFGNRVNWTEALAKGLIKPKDTLLRHYKQVPFDKKLELAADKADTPPAVFPHKAHTPWLDCSNCHPGIFNIKKKTTKHFSMDRIVKFEFCGVCHLQTAFPLDDCSRCHPGMKS